MNRALWHNSSEHSALKLVDPTTPSVNQLKVKSLYSLISTGTERLVAKGLVPEIAASAMRVPYMKGDFSFPVKYGYSLVGEVMNDGPLAGRRVHLLHPHQEMVLVDQEDVFVIPENVPAKRAALASNLETAVNAVWDGGVSVGDRILVAGFGMIGSLVARLIKMMPAVELKIMEKDKKKRQLGREMGFEMVENLEKGYFDIAINTTANGDALQLCIDSVGEEGSVVELSWYGTREVTLKLGADFHYKRKQIISSQVSGIPAARTSRWDYRRRKEVVFELLGSEDFDAHISNVISFEETPAFFNQLRNDEFNGLGCCIRY
ncbi:MAG: dehydrogenase [Bacteroidetes bacterium]|nr:MAG: dehydrogenase [Bacteroidota bacterium]